MPDDPGLKSAERVLDAIRIAIEAMKAADIEPHEAMISMLLLCTRIARHAGTTQRAWREQVDRAWNLAGAWE